MCLKWNKKHTRTNKSNLPEVFCYKRVLKYFAKFTEKHLCQSLFFFNKIQVDDCNFIKREALIEVFSCQYCKSFKNIYFKNICLSGCFWSGCFRRIDFCYSEKVIWIGCVKKCSEKVRKIHRKTTALKSLFYSGVGVLLLIFRIF